MPQIIPLHADNYDTLSPEELSDRIETVRKRLGDEILILGHHYQKSGVLRHCDLRGDSFQLSVAAVESTAWRAIVFCGVHFMAETADILVNTQRKREHRLAVRAREIVPVVIPDVEAGCSMADMATAAQVLDAWNRIGEVVDPETIAPITYVNSSAAIKAFCGVRNGFACTSSNARAVLAKAFEEKGSDGRVLFVPDQHLGRNTALAMGIPDDQIVLWKPGMELDEAASETLRRSRIILWDGYCSVHRKFTPEQIDTIRKAHPGIRVIVHPECPHEVVEKADDSGSTGKIIDVIAASAPGSAWAIGTEGRLVERLAEEYPDRTIVNLAPEPSLCETMDRITLSKLCRMLELIAVSAPTNIVRVEEPVASAALSCLQRMLACRENG